MRNDDYLGKYMTECPKCGHRYNKNLHGSKCPDCGYRKGIARYVPYIVVIVVGVLLLFGNTVTNIFEQSLNNITNNQNFKVISSVLNIINPVYILIGINVILYFCGFDSSRSSELGNSYNNTIRLKQYHRLITSGFVHGDLLHIACNMFSLYNLGTFVYYRVGFWLFLILYFASLVVGGLLSVFIHHKLGDDYVYSVGASGAICGLLGFYVVYIIRSSINPIYSIEYIYKALIPLMVTAFEPSVDNIGHLSGLIIGVLISILL